jgi:hypothetical protein
MQMMEKTIRLIDFERLMAISLKEETNIKL